MSIAQQVPTGPIILRIGAVIVALIVLGVAVLAIRRRLLAADDPAAAPLDMETLQRQKREGAITEEEFRSLRRAILGLPPEDVAEPRPQDTPDA